MDDERLGRALRELRRREGQTQAEAAAAAGVSMRMYRRAEGDRDGSVPPRVLRQIFDPFEARVRVSVWWKGAELDRILDEAHAAVVERVVAVLRARRWETAAEVTFSEYGERGSVDVLGFHRPTRSGLITEVKASWGSTEETNRSLDVKTRLGWKLVEERFGVRPASISRLLVMPNDRTLRRVADRHAETLATVYPARAREIRAWLRSPSGSISGLWFVTFAADS